MLMDAGLILIPNVFSCSQKAFARQFVIVPHADNITGEGGGGGNMDNSFICEILM